MLTVKHLSLCNCFYFCLLMFFFVCFTRCSYLKMKNLVPNYLIIYKYCVIGMRDYKKKGQIFQFSLIQQWAHPCLVIIDIPFKKWNSQAVHCRIQTCCCYQCYRCLHLLGAVSVLDDEHSIRTLNLNSNFLKHLLSSSYIPVIGHM